MKRKLLPLILLCFFGLSTLSTGQVINEFEPNPDGIDSPTQQIEILGTPGAAFSGFFITIESDGNNGTVDRLTEISGTFDGDGILVATVSDLENPSFTAVLATGTTASTGDDIDTNNDGNPDNAAILGTVLDALGIPDSNSDAATQYGADLGGADFAFTGAEPFRVFRDNTTPTGDWYAVNTPTSTQISDINGNSFDAADFSPDPRQLSFGVLNLLSSLPVEMTRFAAKVVASNVDLTWTTASELNNDYFAIEYSTDGRNFVEIDQVNGFGTTNVEQQYQYVHKTPAKGFNYYRLTQVDFDGSSTTSNVEVVEVTVVNDIRIFPTKATNFITIDLAEAAETATQIDVFDLLGRLALSNQMGAASNQTQIDVSNLEKGHYFIRMEMDGQLITKRFIKSN
ncbi:MAG: T9SS type A sorting domain-containing protein [Bacteroidota bacterium]